MFEYTRVLDKKDPEFDSLEVICTERAKDGWRVLSIDNTGTVRTATLERVLPKETLKLKKSV